jgi:hypothetical protein
MEKVFLTGGNVIPKVFSSNLYLNSELSTMQDLLDYENKKLQPLGIHLEVPSIVQYCIDALLEKGLIS